MNSNVSWANPDSTQATGPNGTAPIRLLRRWLLVGATTMTAQQFQALFVIHELGHLFYQDHDGSGQKTYEQTATLACPKAYRNEQVRIVMR